jgi:hypothetical protein
MSAEVQFDMLEVLFFHAPKSDQALTLATLQDAVEPRFEVEALEHVSATQLDHSKQIVRFGSAMGERFDSAAQLERQIRALAGGCFLWARVGAIRANGTATVRA